jgi:hypothetical protein
MCDSIAAEKNEIKAIGFQETHYDGIWRWFMGSMLFIELPPMGME